MSSSRLSDLLNAAADGSQSDAFDGVIERTANRLFQLSRRMLGLNPRIHRWEETDDVFQDSVIRLCRSLRAAKPKSTEEYFGLAALQIRRTLIDLARHHFGPHGNSGRHRSDPMMRAGNQAVLLDDSNEPQTLAQWSAFHSAVDQLPEDERAVFDAVFYGDATYADAAELWESPAER